MEEPVSFDPAALQDVLVTGLQGIATPVIGRAPPALGQVPSTPPIAARKELDTSSKSKSSRHHSKSSTHRDRHQKTKRRTSLKARQGNRRDPGDEDARGYGSPGGDGV